MQDRQNSKPLLMWLLSLTLIVYQAILAWTPNLMMGDMMVKFQLNPSAFATMSKFYYWGYVGMHVPLAIMLDRYTPRTIISASLLLSALGMLFVTYAHTWTLVLVGNLAIGAGSAVCFLGVLRVIAQWFSKHQYSWYIGLTFSAMALASLGLSHFTTALLNITQHTSLQNIFMGIAVFGLLVTVMIYVFLQEPEDYQNAAKEKSVVHLFGQVLRQPLLWVLAIGSLLLVGILNSLPYLEPYFIKTAIWGQSAEDLANLYLFIGLSMGIGQFLGGVFLPFLAKRLKSESLTLILSGLVICGLFAGLLFVPAAFHQEAAVAVLVMLGLFSCYKVLVFSIGMRLVSDAVKIIAVVFLSGLMGAGNHFYKTFLTIMLPKNQMRMADVADIQSALSPILIGCFIGVLCIVGFHCLKKRQNKQAA